MTAAEAADVIDALVGDRPAALGGLLDDLQGAWDEIKTEAEAAAEKYLPPVVRRAIVSIADIIYVGIEYVVGGVTKVVKAVVSTIEDAAAVIGAFFVQLGKALAQVLQALSLFFDLGHILATQRIIRRDVFDKMMAGLEGFIGVNGPKVVQQLADATEKTINDGFDKLIGQLGGVTAPPHVGGGGGGQIAGLAGMGSTTHSALSVTPRGGAQPQAVQGMWAVNKLKQHQGQATLAAPPAAAAGDPLADFFTAFVGDLASDPALSQAYAAAKASFSAGLTLDSPGQLLGQAVGDLLEIFSLIAITGAAVSRELIKGLTALAQELVAALKDPGTIDIPVLSALWRKITGDPSAELSIVDLLALVAAIPVTYLYRAVGGQWPDAASGVASGEGVDEAVVKHVKSLATPMFQIIAGVLTGLEDFIFITAEGLLSLGLVGKLVGATLLLAEAGKTAYELTEPSITSVVLAVHSVCGIAVEVLAPRYFKEPHARAGFMAWMGCGLNVVQLPWIAANDLDEPATTIAADFLALVPGVVGPVKLLPAEASPVPFIAPAADLLFRLVVAGVDLGAAIAGWDEVGGQAPLPAAAAPRLAEG